MYVFPLSAGSHKFSRDSIDFLKLISLLCLFLVFLYF